MTKHTLILLTALFLIFSVQEKSKAEVTQTPTPQIRVRPVDQVDLSRYLNKWYEIASIPQFFQRKCIKNTTAEYSKSDEDGAVSVLNSCDTKDGSRKIATGHARVENSQNNAELKVTFVKIFGQWIYLFGGDYWIIDLDKENYSYAVVGHPKATYGWILSRSPELSREILIKISSNLSEQGYDTCAFFTSIQDAGIHERVKLCDYLESTH